jgi:hypothetical protein
VLAAIAMLAAARSVLREVRGLPARPAAGRASTAADTALNARKSAATTASEADDDADAVSPRRNEDDDTRSQRQGHTEFVDAADGSDADEDLEQSGRHLSKAERKRLRKLSRMSRAA